jgi:hypothetical protein
MASPPDRASLVTKAILADIADGFREWLHYGEPVTALRLKVESRVRDGIDEAVTDALREYGPHSD